MTHVAGKDKNVTCLPSSAKLVYIWNIVEKRRQENPQVHWPLDFQDQCACEFGYICMWSLANSHGFTVSLTDIELVSRERTLISRICLFLSWLKSSCDPALNLILILTLQHFIIHHKQNGFNLWVCSTSYNFRSSMGVVC